MNNFKRIALDLWSKLLLWLRNDLLSLAELKAELETASLIDRFEIPPATPFDLADETPLFLVPRDGARISSRLLASDVAVGRMSPAVTLLWFAAAALIVGMLRAAPAAAMLSLILLPAWSAVFALVLLMRISRNAAYEQGMALPGDAELSLQMRDMLERKTAQCERASKDLSDFWILGKSTARIGGNFGADRDREIGLSALDLSTHLLVTGATGAGKTSGVLRPLARWWANRDGLHGMLVIDGKGDLPREFDGSLRDYRLLIPGRDSINLLAGLEPADIVTALSPAAANDFWSQSAAELLYQCAVLAQRTNYDLVTISKLLGDSKYRNGVCAELSKIGSAELPKPLFRALSFFATGWDPDKNNTQAGVLSTAQSWVNNLLRHPDLLDWAALSNGDGSVPVDITRVLDGARIGLDVPEYKYGSAASAVTALLRAQVYRAAKNRGSEGAKGTQCLVIIDEAALALGPLEAQILPVARSLGLSFCCATQNLEQFLQNFGDSGAFGLIDQFRSLVQLNSSYKTQEYMRSRAGFGIVRHREPREAPAFQTVISREATSLKRTKQSAHETQLTALGQIRSKLGFFNEQVGDGDKLIVGPILKDDVALGAGEAICLLNRAGGLRVESAQLRAVYN